MLDRSEKRVAREYVRGLGQWARQYSEAGYIPKIITFMFRWSGVPQSRRGGEIAEEIERVYSTFLTRVIRRPNTPAGLTRRPVLMACPDWYVYKALARKNGWALDNLQEHAAGILLVRAPTRLKYGIKDHFESSQRDLYIRPDRPLARIHIKRIDRTIERAVGYTFKSLTRGRCTTDEVMIHPKSQDQL